VRFNEGTVFKKKLLQDVHEVYDQHSTHCPLNREVFLVQFAETEKLAKFCSSEPNWTLYKLLGGN
jgi:hypothetical protein